VPDGDNQRIDELVLLDEIEALAEDYRNRHGRLPTDVSHWDPSKEIMDALRWVLPVVTFNNPVPYRYSYLIDQRATILERLGFPSGASAALVTDNGSVSIASVANWLLLFGVRCVNLLRPCYFTTPHNLRRLGIAVRSVAVPREFGEYSLPVDLDLAHGDAIWLTNPVYNTGIYSLEFCTKELLRIADAGALVVADEALALPPSRIAAALGGHRNFIGIYTPHKSICVNAFKFSVIAFHPDYENAFTDWADVLSGGLSLSATAATEHFLTQDFEAYRTEFLKLIDETQAWHKGLLQQYRGAIEADVGARGHFRSIYCPAIEAQRGNDLEFLAELMEATGSALIPGTRSGFDPNLGFSFRINLARDSAQFRSALARLYRTLAARSKR
jgi:hypothetical protein